jgi:hypothetical protein
MHRAQQSSHTKALRGPGRTHTDRVEPKPTMHEEMRNELNQEEEQYDKGPPCSGETPAAEDEDLKYGCMTMPVQK